MTPVLLITNKNDITTDFIVKRLKERNVGFYRFNTEEIGVTIDLHFDFRNKFFRLIDTVLNRTIDLTKVQSVYFRRPELPRGLDGLSRGENSFIRGEMNYTLEGIYKILDHARWINKVNDIRNAENKIFQLQIAENIGFKTPDSIITTQKKAASEFYNRNARSCIIKPIRTGLLEHDGVEEGIIFTNVVSIDVDNIGRIQSCPTYFQEHIQKKGDVRVTVVGNNVFAALIHSQTSDDSKIDWRKSQGNLEHTELQLPETIKEKCIRLVKNLSLNFGAIDFILDEKEEFIFLEINPNGQWAWIERILDLKISDSIANLLTKNLANSES